MSNAIWLAVLASAIGTLLLRMIPLLWMRRRLSRHDGESGGRPLLDQLRLFVGVADCVEGGRAFDSGVRPGRSGSEQVFVLFESFLFERVLFIVRGRQEGVPELLPGDAS